jgi:hypothetical protein
VKLDLQAYKHKAKRLWRWLFGKDILIFLLFVALVSAFWWGQSMNSSRDGNLRVELNYSGVDDRVVLSTPLPTYLTVNVKDKGRQLRQLSKQKITINLNLSSLFTEPTGTLHITADMLRPRLQDILPGTTNIQQLIPEQIKTEYLIQSTKRVPILLQADIHYAPQFQLKNQPQLSIDTINIYGSESVLNAIDYIYTDSLHIDNLRDSVAYTIDLQIPSNIRCRTTQVQTIVQAEQFTDKSFTLPIQTIDVPKGEHMRLFPQQTTVVVRVGISHYAQVTLEDLSAICYYPTSHSDALPIEIQTKNPYISNIRCYPSAVEYIIER